MGDFPPSVPGSLCPLTCPSMSPRRAWMLSLHRLAWCAFCPLLRQQRVPFLGRKG